MKRIATAVATCSVALGAAGGATAPTTTAPSATTLSSSCGDPATPDVLFPSLPAFVDSLNRADAIFDEQHWSPLDPASFVVRPGPEIVAGVLQGVDVFEGADVFAGDLNGQAFVGGLLDPVTGAVQAVNLFGDPDGASTAAAVFALNILCGDPGAADAFANSYRSVAHADDVTAQAYVVQGDRGFAITLSAGANVGDNLVSVAIAPVQDQGAALAEGPLLAIAVASIAVDMVADSPATTSGLPTTTGLPAIGLVTAPPTVPTASVPITGGALTTATSPTTNPPLTTAAPVEGALFASVDDFVAHWNAATATTPGGEQLVLDSSRLALLVGTGPGGLDVFGGRLTEAGIIGGLANAAGAVEHVIIGINPLNPNSSAIVVNAGFLFPDEIWVDVMTAYTDLLGAARGEHRYVAGETADVVIAVGSDDAGNPFVSITVAPVTDEATAIDSADELLRSAVDAAQLSDG